MSTPLQTFPPRVHKHWIICANCGTDVGRCQLNDCNREYDHPAEVTMQAHLP